MKTWILVMASFASLMSSPVFGATNIVVNPGFESDLSNWTVNSSITQPWVPHGKPAQGLLSALEYCYASACTDETKLASANYLYQNLGTFFGGTYILSFDLAENDGIIDNTGLKVLWGNVIVSDKTNYVGNGKFKRFVVKGLTAAGTTTRLTFLGGGTGIIRLDDIYVYRTGVGGVPEPATWIMMILGLGLVGFAMRRRERFVIRLPVVTMLS